MRREVNRTLIGAFLLGAALLAAAGLAVFGGARLFSERKVYVLYFRGDLKGLNVGSPVTFRGVRVGEVTDLRVVVDPGTLNVAIPVTIEVDPRRLAGFDNGGRSEAQTHQALIAKGLRAELALQSLITGQLMVLLDFKPERPATFAGDGRRLEIPTVASPIERLSKGLQELPLEEIVLKLDRTLERLAQLLEARTLEATLASTGAAVEELRALIGHLDARVGPAADSLQQALEDLRGMVGSVEGQIEPLSAQAAGTLAAAQGAIRQAEATLALVNDLAGRVASGDAPLQASLVAALEEIRTAARAVASLAEYLERQPDALWRGRRGEP